MPTMHEEGQESTRLPPGYSLDLVGDPCVIIVRREDGTLVARFTHNADPEEIRRAAEEDYQGPIEA
jgi:hypothetical protein